MENTILSVSLETKGGPCWRFSPPPRRIRTFFMGELKISITRIEEGEKVFYKMERQAPGEMEKFLEERRGKLEIKKITSPEAISAFEKVADFLENFPGLYYNGTLPLLEENFSLIAS